MEKFFKKHIRHIVRKQAKKENYRLNLKLSQNEKATPYGYNFFSTFIHSIDEPFFTYYPNLKPLIFKIAKYVGLAENNIMVTAGSDVGIKTIIESIDFTNQGHILTTDYSFPMYNVYAEQQQIEYRTVAYKSLRIDVKDILSSVNMNTRLLILANPNSPLGDYLDINELKPLLDTGIPLLLDEAYIELSDKPSLAEYTKQYKNLIITRTFSKGLGAAGCRVGYIVAHEDTLSVLSKLKHMYEVNSIGARYAEHILDNIHLHTEYKNTLLTQKEEVVKRIKELGLRIYNTDSSWFFVDSNQIKPYLRDSMILLREIELPVDTENTYVKFNYDPRVKETSFYNKLWN